MIIIFIVIAVIVILIVSNHNKTIEKRSQFVSDKIVELSFSFKEIYDDDEYHDPDSFKTLSFEIYKLAFYAKGKQPVDFSAMSPNPDSMKTSLHYCSIYEKCLDSLNWIYSTRQFSDEVSHTQSVTLINDLFNKVSERI